MMQNEEFLMELQRDMFNDELKYEKLKPTKEQLEKQKKKIEEFNDPDVRNKAAEEFKLNNKVLINDDGSHIVCISRIILPEWEYFACKPMTQKQSEQFKEDSSIYRANWPEVQVHHIEPEVKLPPEA